MSTLTRVNLIMLAVLVVQLVVIFLLPKQGAAEATKTRDDLRIAGTQPFSSLDMKDVRGVTVTSGDGKVIQLSGTVKKEGDKDVPTWTIASRDNFPARTSDVEKIVESAKKIMYSRVMTRQEKRYARLNVADGVMHARVQIAGEGGKSLADFRIGESKDFNSVYVRRENDPAVYEATGVSTWEFPTTLSGLVDTGFLDLPADQVARVKLVSGADTIEVVKEVPESRPASGPVESRAGDSGPTTSRAAETKPEPKWITVTLDHQTLDKTKVDSWIRGLARLNLSDPIGKERKPEYGFDKPTATATLTMADGKETTITIGAERKEERDYYLTATGKDFVVTVPTWNVTEQFQKKLKDLLPGPGTPELPPPHDHEHENR